MNNTLDATTLRSLIVEELMLAEIGPGSDVWLDPKRSAQQADQDVDNFKQAQYPGRGPLMLDWVQNILTPFGFVPGIVGPGVDFSNGLISLLRGNPMEAALFLVATIPGGPEITATGLRLLLKVFEPLWHIIKAGKPVTKAVYENLVKKEIRIAAKPFLLEISTKYHGGIVLADFFVQSMKSGNWMKWWDDILLKSGGKYKKFSDMPFYFKSVALPVLKLIQQAVASATDVETFLKFLSKTDFADWYESHYDPDSPVEDTRFRNTPGNIFTGRPSDDEASPSIEDFALEENSSKFLRVILDEEYADRHIDELILASLS